jgi:hypothetical protein
MQLNLLYQNSFLQIYHHLNPLQRDKLEKSYFNRIDPLLDHIILKKFQE